MPGQGSFWNPQAGAPVVGHAMMAVKHLGQDHLQECLTSSKVLLWQEVDPNQCLKISNAMKDTEMGQTEQNRIERIDKNEQNASEQVMREMQLCEFYLNYVCTLT